MVVRRDDLTHYRKKRDFNKTSEPKGLQKKGVGSRYLIQKHAATRLHYDFRLELDGVLKSWAVTRGPSLDPHDKRLAVEVEDHPLEYGSFEGTIPKGQYGGGTVMLWDVGTWEPIGDPHTGLSTGKLKFRLYGKRLTGEWTLVRIRARDKDKNKTRNNWLLIKHHDDAANIGDDGEMLEKNLTSIVSRRTIQQIASTGTHIPAKKKKKLILPAFIPPELATLTDTVPQGDSWVHEIKFDGYRALTYFNQGDVQVLTRTGQNWTHKFQSLASLLTELPAETAILDGEILALDDTGVSSFKMLQEALRDGKSERLQYYVFDLLYLNGADLTRLPLRERKQQLERLLKGRSFAGRVLYSEHFSKPDKTFLERLCSLQLEGIVSKRIDDAYISGRGTSWLKTKCHKRQELVIGGFTFPSHAERGIGALLIGYYQDQQLIYAGKVGTGFDNETSRQLHERLSAIQQEEMSFESVPADGKRGAHWVKPKLVCEVEFTEWTPDGRLRHPSFQGLRDDKPPRSVHRDVQVALATEKRVTQLKKSVSNSNDVLIDNIKITHPARIIYPGTQITKQRLAEYYLEIAEHILPHVAERPLSLVRCPEGIQEPCFFQRHLARSQSPHLYDTEIGVKGRNETYLMIKDVKGLITLVQWGVIELHPWNCHINKPETPDQIIFDLDPDPDVPWRQVAMGAQEIRARMLELGLESFVKTTGGKGLHVTIPFTPDYSWHTIKAFTRAVADSMAHDNPKIYVATASKAARKGRIFVDYLRNDRTATAVAPYSARARAGAPVATPLAWSELKTALDPTQLTIETVAGRLHKRKNDPWSSYFMIRQSISASHLRALKITPE